MSSSAGPGADGVQSMVEERGGASSLAAAPLAPSRAGRSHAPTAICASNDYIRLLLRGILRLDHYPVTKESASPGALGRPPPESRVLVYDTGGAVAGGVESLEALARENPGLPVLALLPVGGEGLRAEAERAGARGTLVKPFSAHDLTEAIDALVCGSWDAVGTARVG